MALSIDIYFFDQMLTIGYMVSVLSNTFNPCGACIIAIYLALRQCIVQVPVQHESNILHV